MSHLLENRSFRISQDYVKTTLLANVKITRQLYTLYLSIYNQNNHFLDSHFIYFEEDPFDRLIGTSRELK